VCSSDLCSSDDYDNISTHDALTRLFAHINSLGRYGTTAFLYPLYGCGELSQGFCRMCAVWGGTCILKRKTDRLIINNSTKNIEESIVTSIEDNEGRIFECDAFVCGSEQWLNLPGVTSLIITRCSVFDDKLLPTGRSMLVIPPMTNGISNTEAIFVIQIDAEAMVVPDGACIVHILTESVINEDIRSKKDWDEYILNHSSKAINEEMNLVVKMLLDTKSTKELLYTTTIRPKFKESAGLLGCINVPKNVAICEDDISYDIHCDNIVHQAKKIFHRIFPNEDFLPIPENPQYDDGGDNDMESDMIKATLASFEKSESS
jgi:RAB protein geranylgeranyltransferase component A